MREFQYSNLGSPLLGLVLNLFDYDGDGNGEVMFFRKGYEGARMRLLEYTESGLQPTDISYSYGC